LTPSLSAMPFGEAVPLTSEREVVHLQYVSVNWGLK